MITFEVPFSLGGNSPSLAALTPPNTSRVGAPVRDGAPP